MDRAQKAETVEALKGVFAGAGVVVVGHYAGLTVADLTVLRTPPPQGRRCAQGSEEPPGETGDRRHAEGVPPARLRAPRQSLTPPTRYRPPRSPSPTRRKRKSSSFWADCSAISCSTSKAMQLWPRCLRWTSCVGRSSAWCRRPRPRSLACSPRRAASWRACSTPTPPRTQPNRHIRIR